MTNVTVVSTPDDGSCGIGTYTGDLLRSMPESAEARWVRVPLRAANPLPYLRAAVRAGMTGNPTIHVQHEYGIYGPNSLWSWLFFAVLMVLSRIRGRRVIVTFHSAWNNETVSPPLVGLKRLYVAANNRLLTATADSAIFLSDNAADAFQRSVNLDAIEVLPHGVQVDTKSMEPAAAKESLGYDPDKTLIVEPGYIRREKGCDTFIEIAARVDDAEFLLAGGCQGDKEYCETVSEMAPNNVRITGELTDDEFHAAFNAADVVLLPYREVTQSGVFNWCVAYELPVLASEADYFRSLADRWNCVETVDTEDRAAVAAQLRELLADEERCSELRDGMADYREAASMSTVAEHHLELYGMTGD